jgi:hypothetical protein
MKKIISLILAVIVLTTALIYNPSKALASNDVWNMFKTCFTQNHNKSISCLERYFDSLNETYPSLYPRCSNYLSILENLNNDQLRTDSPKAHDYLDERIKQDLLKYCAKFVG